MEIDWITIWLFLEVAAGCWVLVHAWRSAGRDIEKEKEGAAYCARTAALRLHLLGAWRALRLANWPAWDLDLVKLSALIEKTEEGDPRATPELAAFLLERFPGEIVGPYLSKIRHL